MASTSLIEPCKLCQSLQCDRSGARSGAFTFLVPCAAGDESLSCPQGLYLSIPTRTARRVCADRAEGKQTWRRSKENTGSIRECPRVGDFKLGNKVVIPGPWQGDVQQVPRGLEPRFRSGRSKASVGREVSLSLRFAWYNFCRAHSPLHATPAMAVGISSGTWSPDALLHQSQASARTGETCAHRLRRL